MTTRTLLNMARRCWPWPVLAAVLMVVAACTHLPRPAVSSDGFTIPCTLRRPARVSINIRDAHGRVVRELWHAAPCAAGRGAASWDGRDDDGKPVPPGDYRWESLATPGLRAEYLMSLGSSYPSGLSDWRHRGPGTHGGPTAVATDGTGIYVAASCTENIENYLLKMDPAATRRVWSAVQHVAWNGGIALASANGIVFVLGNNREVWLYDAATGALGATLHPVTKDEKPADLAARGAHLVVCYTANDLVQWLDAKSGAVLDAATVPAPMALAVTGDGTVFAISGKSVVRLSREHKDPVSLVTGLAGPQRLDVDAATGDLIVADGGVSQQVKRFSREGRLLATYGRAGGRRDGLYDPRDFRDVTDVAADGTGGFFVAEPNAAPRRVAHFDRQGQLRGEWYGGQTWAPWVSVEPDNPNAVWMNSSWTDMMRLTVDYATRTWKIHSVYHYADMAGGLVPGNANALLWEARLHDGSLYLCRAGDPTVLRVDRQKWRLVPATLTHKHVQHYRSALPPLIVDLAKGTDVFQWNDRDADGMPQREEVTTGTGAPWNCTPTIDAQMNYLFINGTKVMANTVNGWTPAGAPVYGDLVAPQTVAACPPRVTNIEGRWGSYLGRDPETGDLYGAFNDRMPDWGKSKDSFLVKWNAAGQEQWTVGRLGDGRGRIWRPFRRFAGFAHGCPVLTGFSYEYPQDGPTATYAWDRDGLWVGSVFDTLDLAAASENLYSLGAEALAATLVTEPDGNVLFFGCWLNEVRVYRITGWNGWVRRSGKLTVPVGFQPPRAVATPAGAGTGLRGEYFRTPTPQAEALVLARLDPALDFTWGVWGTGTCTPLPDIKTPYSVRWTGSLIPRETGLYAFRSDGPTAVGRIMIGGQTFQTPGADRASRATYRVWLDAGRAYPVQVEYCTEQTHPTTVHGIKLQWLPPSGVWDAVPTGALYPSPAPAPSPPKKGT